MAAALATTFDYLRTYGNELGERIVDSYSPLHKPGDALSPELARLKRKPLPAQSLAIMGTVKFWQNGNRAAKLVAECGTGKTLMSMSACFAHAAGKAHTAIVMCPPHLPRKWAREIFQTLPNVRVFMVEDMRNNGDPKKPHGIVEVVLRNGEIERKGLKLTLTQLRHMGRKGFRKLVPQNAYFVMSKERGKLSYFWRHAFGVAQSGPHLGNVVSMDTGRPVDQPSGRVLSRLDFDTQKFTEDVCRTKGGTKIHSALWQADKGKLQRMAPLEYMGRYMHEFFDYAIADELHQLGGDTAQGNGLAVLERISRRLVGLTGTMIGGFADDLYNILYRMDAPQMARDGYAWGGEGRTVFQSKYGVCEEVVKRSLADNACSKASKPSVTVKRRPGCSPLLFGRYLMESTAFVSLEDIASDLPAYNESVIPVAMEGALEKAYTDVRERIKDALRAYPRNSSLTSLMLNTLLCYPDHPFDFGPLYAKVRDKRTGELQTVHVCDPKDLDKGVLYPKEQALLDDVKAEIREGRKVQVFATFTGAHDVTARLRYIFEQAGLRVAVLKASVPTDAREAWYKARLAEGVQVVLAHPKLVETGLDLLEFPTLYFYETGYSLYTLRQASRRSWRIGQKRPVRVKFLMYSGTMQETQVRLIGKKLLVAMMMEGKFSGEGLDGFEEDDDMMSSMVRELLEEGGVGESADAIWANLERERALHVPEPSHREVEEALEQVAGDSAIVYSGSEELSFSEALALDATEPEAPRPFLVETTVTVAEVQPLPAAPQPATTNLLMFAATPTRKPSRRTKPVFEDQLALFG